jgi:hypothetical protein
MPLRIEISSRLRPYSRRPGTQLLLPGTRQVVTCRPTRLTLEGVGEFRWDVQGDPLAPFTVEQDLERGSIRVWCQCDQGLLRYRLHSTGLLEMERGPEPVERCQLQLEPIAPPAERLSLGSHRQQEWERISRNAELEDLLPIWMRLGQMVGLVKAPIVSLLADLEQARPEQVGKLLRTAFQVGFSGMMVPHAGDPHGWGFQVEGDPLALLTQGSGLIRGLFVREQGDELKILAQLPPELHCGRFCQVQTSWGSLDMEWSKKQIRRICLRPDRPLTLKLQLQSGIRSFRSRTGQQDRGETHQVGKTLLLEQPIWLDRFDG